MVYFIADMHLGHANILKHCNRPFSSVEEMDETLIENWNSRVTDRDDVWIVGDFAFRTRVSAEIYLKNLKGRKHLVKGNHDKTWMKGLDLSRYFGSVNEIAEMKLDGRHIVLCHYPMMCWDKSHYGSYLIFGHIHNDTDLPFWDMIKDNDHMLNAGVDVNGFYPVTFDELVENNRRFRAEKEAGCVSSCKESLRMPASL